MVWGIIGRCIGANDIATNSRQYWLWIDCYIPQCKQSHGFGLAAIRWAIWKARNKACFEKKLIKHPAEIICHVCSFMSFWTDLYKSELQSRFEDGVKVLLKTACRILATRQDTPPVTLRLMPADDDEEHEDDN